MNSILTKILKLLVNVLKFQLNKLTRRSVIIYFCLFLPGIYWLYYNEIIIRDVLRNLDKELKLELARNQGDRNVNEGKVNFKFIHNAYQTCQKRPPFLVLLIKSKVTYFEERNAVRNTWAQLDEYGLIRRVFLIGMPNPNDVRDTSEVTKKVDEESERFNDIVQQDFYDAYLNNTLQTLMGIKWAFYYCYQAKFYLFIDDDNLLNPKLLIERLKVEMTKPAYETFYGGYVITSERPCRDANLKVCISKDVYPYSRYPPFISGSFYILAPKTVKLFYMASQRIRLFKFDDVYLGMLALALDIKPVFIDRVYSYTIPYDPHVYANKVISMHKISGSDMFEKWKTIENSIKFNPESLRNFLKSDS